MLLVAGMIFIVPACTNLDEELYSDLAAENFFTTDEENIDWLSVDVGVTTSVANNKRLYIYGYTDADIVPPVLTQGYRVGAKVHDKVYVDFSAVTGYATSEAKILMTDNSSSSFKEYPKVVFVPSLLA